MARMSRSMLSAPRLLVITSSVVALLSVLPPGGIRWVGSLSKPIVFLIGPVNKAMGWGASFVSSGTRANASDSPEVSEVRRQLEEYKFQWLNERQENERLRRVVEELQKTPLSTEVMRQVYAPIIGGGADLSAGILKAKAGEREGVIPGSVVVVEGVHVVGRVREVTSRYSLILPITQKASRGMKGVIMVGDQRGPFCDLVPTDRGTLNGKVFFDEGVPRPDLKPGMLVRLDDPEWPSSARMLIIGQIIEVVPLPQQPNRPVVTVRPQFAIDKISEVVIRIPTDAMPLPGGTGGTR